MMLRSIAGTLALTAVLALGSALAGCGDDEETTTSTADGAAGKFVKSDLPKLAFNPDDVPPDTALNTQKMGYGAVASKGTGAQWVREQGKVGLEENYDVQFFGSKVTDPFVESIVYLYPDEASAERGLALALKQNRSVTEPVTNLDAEQLLGPGAWGINGKFEGQQTTATYGWRTANAVQMSVWGGDSPADNADKALQNAQKLQSQAEDVLTG